MTMATINLITRDVADRLRRQDIEGPTRRQARKMAQVAADWRRAAQREYLKGRFDAGWNLDQDAANIECDLRRYGYAGLIITIDADAIAAEFAAGKS
jgi:hypothetical protein